MLDYETLDPGIRDIVRKLNDMGWETTDSGDGCSKDMSDPEVLPCAHVAVSVMGKYNLITDADLMLIDLRAEADRFPPGYRIEATYDPADESAVLLVTWPGPLPAAANGER